MTARLLPMSLILLASLAACGSPQESSAGTPTPSITKQFATGGGALPSQQADPTLGGLATPSYAVTLTFSLKRWPAVSDHIRDAEAAGESKVCTIDRGGADRRRVQSLAGHPTAKGMDRDEFPFAICAEGGAGADVRLVPSGENRSSGAWLGNRLERYPNGSRVLVMVGR